MNHNNHKKKKRPALPIPEPCYERFKYRLEELSGDYKERNMTIFLLEVASGYRLQDIVDLTIAEIKEALIDGYFEIQEKKQYKAWLTHIKKYPKSTKKAPKKRKYIIPSKVEKILKDYIKGRKKSEYAFQSRNGNGSRHISAKSYSDILKRVAEDNEINLKNITGHSLRKTYARRLYESTNDLEFVRIALGHKSIEVTKIYLGLEENVKEKSSDIAQRLL